LFAAVSASFPEDAPDDHRAAILQAIGAIAQKEILQPADEYRKLNQAMTTAASRDQQAIADRMGTGLLLLGMCGSVAGLLAGRGLARGVRRSLMQMSIPINDATGALNQVIGPITVSSEEGFEQMEAALREMSDRVAKVVEQYQAAQIAMTRAERLAAMGQLAAGLAHELRNPLTSMKILIQAACEGEDSATLDRKDLGVLREEVGRLNEIIQNYLDYARPPQLVRGEFALRRVVEQSVELVETRAAQMDLRIECCLPERIVKVDVDAGQIRQVLLNLLLNAVDASPEGEIIALRMHFESEDGSPATPATEDVPPRWVVIDVADRGPGLPAELDGRIFEPFVSTKEAGTGLGLSTCRRIVEDHGGHIVAANRPDGGAVFTVWLPIRAGQSPPQNG
jgi:signal transduction histidine kinase